MSKREVVLRDAFISKSAGQEKLTFTSPTADGALAFFRATNMDGTLAKNMFISESDGIALRDFLNEQIGDLFTKEDMDRAYASGREAGLRDASNAFDRLVHTFREEVRP